MIFIIITIINVFSFFLTWYIILSIDYNDFINDYMAGIYPIIFFISYFIRAFNLYFPIILLPSFVSLISIVICTIPYTKEAREIFFNFKLVRPFAKIIFNIFHKQKKLDKIKIKEME